ncbi:MAG: sel1 repeat family protein [Prevotella sp.]|nr:sel1 repeat family protein [Prevotella sp.]
MKRQLFILLFAMIGCLPMCAQNADALYEEGKALYDAKNYVEAIAKLKPAAEKGHKKAQYRMGRCYDKGNGVGEDNVEAVRWYAKSAEQGYAKAEYQMARAYLKGKGGLKVDKKKAKSLLKNAVGGKKHGKEILDEIKKDAAEGDNEAKQLLELLAD